MLHNKFAALKRTVAGKTEVMAKLEDDCNTLNSNQVLLERKLDHQETLYRELATIYQKNTDVRQALAEVLTTSVNNQPTPLEVITKHVLGVGEPFITGELNSLKINHSNLFSMVMEDRAKLNLLHSNGDALYTMVMTNRELITTLNANYSHLARQFFAQGPQGR